MRLIPADEREHKILHAFPDGASSAVLNLTLCLSMNEGMSLGSRIFRDVYRSIVFRVATGLPGPHSPGRTFFPPCFGV